MRDWSVTHQTHFVVIFSQIYMLAGGDSRGRPDLRDECLGWAKAPFTLDGLIEPVVCSHTMQDTSKDLNTNLRFWFCTCEQGLKSHGFVTFTCNLNMDNPNSQFFFRSPNHMYISHVLIFPLNSKFTWIEGYFICHFFELSRRCQYRVPVPVLDVCFWGLGPQTKIPDPHQHYKCLLQKSDLGTLCRVHQLASVFRLGGRIIVHCWWQCTSITDENLQQKTKSYGPNYPGNNVCACLLPWVKIALETKCFLIELVVYKNKNNFS